jgi:hypothetical protein
MHENTKQNIDWAGKLGVVWCAVMHNSPMWPIHGEYKCRDCGTRFPVPWAAQNIGQAPLSQRPVPSF